MRRGRAGPVAASKRVGGARQPGREVEQREEAVIAELKQQVS